MTDGDSEVELLLFQEFYSSTEAAIDTLTANCTDGPNENWRSNAHAIKGIAYNIGAHVLGDLCKQAQDNAGASASEKEALLKNIKSQYSLAKAYLQKLHLKN